MEEKQDFESIRGGLEVEVGNVEYEYCDEHSEPAKDEENAQSRLKASDNNMLRCWQSRRV